MIRNIIVLEKNNKKREKKMGGSCSKLLMNPRRSPTNYFLFRMHAFVHLSLINKSLLFLGVQSSATPPKTPQDTNNDVSI